MSFYVVQEISAKQFVRVTKKYVGIWWALKREDSYNSCVYLSIQIRGITR